MEIHSQNKLAAHAAIFPQALATVHCVGFSSVDIVLCFCLLQYYFHYYSIYGALFLHVLEIQRTAQNDSIHSYFYFPDHLSVCTVRDMDGYGLQQIEIANVFTAWLIAIPIPVKENL